MRLNPEHICSLHLRTHKREEELCLPQPEIMALGFDIQGAGKGGAGGLKISLDI